MPVSRVRSHRLPQNEEPRRGAKAGLGKHTERMRSLACAEDGGRDTCMQGLFFKGKAMYSVAHKGKEDTK